MKRYLTGLALAAWMTVMVGCAPEAPDADMSAEPATMEPADGMGEMTPDSNTTGAGETIVAPEVPVVEEAPATEEAAPAAEEPAPAAEEPAPAAEEPAPAAEEPAPAEEKAAE